MRRFFIVAMAASLAWQLTGCMSVPPQARGLHGVAHADSIVLHEKVSHEAYRGLFNVHWRWTLLPGVYKAEKENASGIFYRGQGRLVVEERAEEPGSNKRPYVIYAIGGIWVPRDASQSPQIYSYVEASPHLGPSPSLVPAGAPVVPGAVGGAVGGLLVAAIIQADVGKIVLWGDPKDLDFAAKIMAGLQPPSP